MNRALLSSNTNEWETPQWLFDELDKEFHFDLDPCATELNAKCEKFFDLAKDGLKQSWGGHTVFCNPPYSRDVQDKWILKCEEEARKDGTTVVALLPARTDTARFHDHIYHKAEIRFLRGRIKFGAAKYNAPFPSMVVIWRQHGKTD